MKRLPTLTATSTKRTMLYLSVAGLAVMVAAVTAISSLDPSGTSPRIVMIGLTTAAGLWLPWRRLATIVLLVWLAPNLARTFVEDVSFVNANMALELPGLAGIAFFASMIQRTLSDDEISSQNPLAALGETGIFPERQLRPFLEVEIARSRRFQRSFSLVLVGIDARRQKFDFRNNATWKASLLATANLLKQTRKNVDRVFHYSGAATFAIILPESAEKDIPGLVRRLRRLARAWDPPEGEPGGPLPAHFGATFFPECATSIDDMLRRAEVALRLAAVSTTRYQIDGAEAPELPPAETLRREDAWPNTVAAEEPGATAGVTQADPEAASTLTEAESSEAEAPADPEASPSTSGPTRAEGSDTADDTTQGEDDLEAMLNQMDETLKMIRAARKNAA
jgi:GGDEF domain-containing protein